MKKPSFTTEFKLESAALVIDQGYSIKEASQAVGVSDSAMRTWVTQLKKERGGETPVGRKALTPDQQKIQQLQLQIKRLEQENEIIKKATALLMSDSLKSFR